MSVIPINHLSSRGNKLAKQLSNIHSDLDKLNRILTNQGSDIDNLGMDGISYQRLNRLNLDNCIQDDEQIVLATSTYEDDDMAKEHRLRVCVGYKDNGEPVTRQASAKSELELADKAFRMIIKSGRIAEFMPEIFQQLQETKHEPEAVKEKTKLSDYIRHWHDTYKAKLAANTVVFYKSKENNIIRYFGDMCIEDIKQHDVQNFLNARAEEVSYTTVDADWGTLIDVLNSAVEDGIITANPAKSVSGRLKNTAEKGEGTFALTKEQYRSIQDAIPTLEDDQERNIIALLAYTSLRREELLGLRWENIDFTPSEHYQFGSIDVVQAVVCPVNKPVLKGTKTKSSKRKLAMQKNLCELLMRTRRESGYVLSTEDGEPLSAAMYYRKWDSLAQHIELYGATAMNFRTTFCTMSIASGNDVHTTQVMMGHSTPDTTLGIYTKFEQTRYSAGVDKVYDFIHS